MHCDCVVYPCLGPSASRIGFGSSATLIRTVFYNCLYGECRCADVSLVQA